MALNNLRVVYNNLADLSATTITSSFAGSSPLSNLQKDAKGSVWRSATNTAAATTAKTFLLVDFGTGTAPTVTSVILPYTNLSASNATITVTGYSSAGVAPTFGGTIALPTVSVVGAVAAGVPTNNMQCCPWNSLGINADSSNPAAANLYAYGGGTCARVWLTTSITARYLLIEINDNFASKTNSYIEVGRLVVGSHWSPKYNTGYGMSNTIRDLSTHERTESGDLVTQRGPRFNSLNFNLDFLDQSDRQTLSKIMLGNGMPKPMFVSLFPNNGTALADAEMERAHQIYGKLVTLPGVNYSTLNMYSTQFELEEV